MNVGTGVPDGSYLTPQKLLGHYFVGEGFPLPYIHKYISPSGYVR